MPIYEYRARDKGCPRCSEGFEVVQAFHESPLKECPECHGPVYQIISRIGRIDVAYSPSDAFKHYTRQMEEKQKKMEKEGKIEGTEE